jgi:hypothetical protein
MPIVIKFAKPLWTKYVLVTKVPKWQKYNLLRISIYFYANSIPLNQSKCRWTEIVIIFHFYPMFLELIFLNEEYIKMKKYFVKKKQWKIVSLKFKDNIFMTAQIENYKTEVHKIIASLTTHVQYSTETKKKEKSF